MDTIFALSSGQPPAAIAVLRISGSRAGRGLAALAGPLPDPRHASLRKIYDDEGALLDRALVLWFPGPNTATGEDLAELHLHGGRAVVASVERALARLEGFRSAEPGEFTRRAFANGRIDLAEAEGLADLLEAETELQRRSALEMAGGAFSAQVGDWRDRLLALSAQLEATLDFEDEDDVAALPGEFLSQINSLADEMGTRLDAPHAEALKEGYRVVLAGPPNVGKSTLFNALVEREAAITAPQPGTTRDVLVRPVAIEGIPFSFVDTAGLREDGTDDVELIGIVRARGELEAADLVLWPGVEGEGPPGCWEIDPRIDRDDHEPKLRPGHRVSAMTGEGLDGLRRALVETASRCMPKPGLAALNARQRGLLGEATEALGGIEPACDPLILAERLRLARVAFDRLIGRSTTEDMLNALFGRFCIGK
jgi:tRNA modification GTPase